MELLIAMAPQGGEGGGSLVSTLIMFGAIFLIFYFMIIRPQQKKSKSREKLLSNLEKGDKVVTTGGMFGTIFAIDDERNRIVLKIGDDTKMEFLKSSIAARVDK